MQENATATPNGLARPCVIVAQTAHTAMGELASSDAMPCSYRGGNVSGKAFPA